MTPRCSSMKAGARCRFHEGHRDAHENWYGERWDDGDAITDFTEADAKAEEAAGDPDITAGVLHTDPFPAVADADNAAVVRSLVNDALRYGHTSLRISVSRVERLLSERAASEQRIARLEQALRLMLEAIHRHNEWCGYNRDAPGNGIFRRALQDADAALAASSTGTGTAQEG